MKKSFTDNSVQRQKLEQSIKKKLEKSRKPSHSLGQSASPVVGSFEAPKNRKAIASSKNLSPLAYYALMLSIVWWIFMQPKQYIEYLRNSNERRLEQFRNASTFIIFLLGWIVFLIPIASVALELSPPNPFVILEDFSLYATGIFVMWGIIVLSIPFDSYPPKTKIVF